MKKPWTKYEILYLREKYPDSTISIRQIAENMGRTIPMVQYQARKLGLKKTPVHKKWTPEKIKMLRKYYPDLQAKEVASKIDMSVSSIWNKAQELKLRKSRQFYQKEAQRLLESGAKYRFSKGHVPANKGKKMAPEVYEKVKHTFFKSGHLPKNTKYDGHISIRKDKLSGKSYKYIRVAQGNYIELHRFVWENQNGKIPSGHNIVFKNGNTLDCRIENLECISNKELMQRNTIHRYPSELKSQMRKLGKLKKKIQTITKN